MSKSSSSPSVAAAKYDRFVEEYFIHGENATLAAIACGYSPKTATNQGSRLCRHVHIAGKIQARREQLLAGAQLTAQEVLEDLARELRFDPATVYDKNGRLLPVGDMPKAARLCLEGLDIDEVSHVTGNGKTRKHEITVTAKVKFPKKATARDQAMRHFGLFARDKAGHESDSDSEPPPSVGITIDFKDARRKKPA